MAQAAASGRVFLTRDASLAVRRDAVACAPYLLASDDPRLQLQEVARRWGVVWDEARAMSRCAAPEARLPGRGRCSVKAANAHDDSQWEQVCQRRFGWVARLRSGRRQRASACVPGGLALCRLAHDLCGAQVLAVQRARLCGADAGAG